jgi:hypothetical protein
MPRSSFPSVWVRRSGHESSRRWGERHRHSRSSRSTGVARGGIGPGRSLRCRSSSPLCSFGPCLSGLPCGEDTPVHCVGEALHHLGWEAEEPIDGSVHQLPWRTPIVIRIGVRRRGRIREIPGTRTLARRSRRSIVGVDKRFQSRVRPDGPRGRRLLWRSGCGRGVCRPRGGRLVLPAVTKAGHDDEGKKQPVRETCNLHGFHPGFDHGKVS